MNKELREDLEHILICKDKTITQDLRDDIKMTLDYIDELEEENKNDYFIHMEEWARAIGNNAKLREIIDKAIEYNQKIYDTSIENERLMAKINLDILRGKDNGTNRLI